MPSQSSQSKWTSLKWIKLRILLVSVSFVLFLGLILFRSYQLQIAGNTRVNRLAKVQHQTSLYHHPKRGTIYDRNKQILAQDIEVTSIALHPHLIKDAEKLSQLLQSHLKIKASELNKKIKSNKKFVWIVRRIDSDIGAKIQSYKLKSVSVIKEYRRFYPNKELAGHLLGAVGYDAKALGGLELSYDSYLRTSQKKWLAKKDAKGRVYTPLKSDSTNHDVYLTLDSNIQFIAERVLGSTAKKYKAASGFAIVAKPQTGEVLAMANYPPFNPNRYWKYPLSQWKNHAIVTSFEPGSTFKAVLAAAALEGNKISMDEKFFCENGRYLVGKKVIHDHEPYGKLKLADIMRVSSNIGVTKIVQKIGRTPFYSMIKRLGFGEKIDIGFPGEHSGRVQPPQNWQAIDESNISFGQGLSVNALQMVKAYTAFANDGLLSQPYVVSKIMSSEGHVKNQQPNPLGQVMTPKIARQVTGLLDKVVAPDGTGKLAGLSQFPVAGKTGTSQKYNPRTGGYHKDDYISSFIGYVPSDRPEFLIYIVYDSPKPVHYGGLTAAPAFKQIATEVLAYSGIPPRKQQLAQVSRKKK